MEELKIETCRGPGAKKIMWTRKEKMEKNTKKKKKKGPSPEGQDFPKPRTGCRKRCTSTTLKGKKRNVQEKSVDE